MMRIRAQSAKRNAAFRLLLALLLVVCISMAAVTRLGYSDYARDAEALMLLPYDSYSYEDSARCADADEEFTGYLAGEELVEDADMVVTCEFVGAREVAYLAMVSSVRVENVLKGRAELAGDTIEVFEPVAIELGLPTASEDSSDAEGDTGTTRDDGRVLVPSDAYEYGATMMREAEAYLLFLKRSATNQNRYVLCDSPYAKLSLNARAEARLDSEGVLSAGEMARYEVLAANEKALDEFRTEKARLVEMLHL